MSPERPKQPDDGDIVLHCGHLDAHGLWLPFQQHERIAGWFYWTADSRLRKAYWRALCANCRVFPEWWRSVKFLGYGPWHNGKPTETVGFGKQPERTNDGEGEF